MIDLHCHILAGIDDGAQHIDESIALLHAAINDGITHAVCTPHIQFGRFDNTINTIEQVFNQLQQQVHAEALAIKIAFAAEVRICPEIMLLAKQNKLPFIGQWQGKNVLLLELPHSHIPAGTEQLIKWLNNNNIIPMIAHPERNRDIIADITKLSRIPTSSCLYQITAASLCGDFGEAPQKIAEQLLREDKVTIIATDTHNLKRRPPKLTAAKLIAEQLIGAEVAQRLVYDTPKLISESKFN
ncbi:tyrosine protein phosphatase [Colwellia asteriadis]|uniref:protein-tyrosine-phosphatase n=1 Tax=Colwellia asteriadis TaxID=517723 RepID=A0ABN1L2E9_9GAMM